MRLQVAVMLTLAPLTFAVFGGVSIVGLAVNFLAIPLVSFVFVPLVLAGALAAMVAPLACGWLFGLAALLHEWLWPALVWSADLELAQWRADPAAWWLVLAIPAALLLLLRWPWALRLTAAGMALPLLYAPSRLPGPGTAQVSVLDAGRGSAVLVATHSHVLLFDTGDAWNTHGARAARVVIPALDALGRRRVDLLVLPGLNTDRALGSALLATERAVSGILVGGGWPATSLPVTTCEDAHFEWDGVGFEVFAAGPGSRQCALRVSTGAHALLLGGEGRNLPRPSEEVLVVERDGARAPLLLESVRPRIPLAAAEVEGAEPATDRLLDRLPVEHLIRAVLEVATERRRP